MPEARALLRFRLELGEALACHEGSVSMLWGQQQSHGGPAG